MARPVVIGIAGGTASGKTMVARRIYETLGSDRVAIIKQDSYYCDLAHLEPAQRARQNFDHPDAFDIPLLRHHLEELIAGRGIDEPTYDFTQHMRAPETRRQPPAAVIVIEGILILAEPTLRELMDIKVYVDTDSDVRLVRRIRRDVEERGRTVQSVLRQYEQSVRPMHLQFVEPSKRYADVIVPEGGHNAVAIDLLRTKIAAVLMEAWIEIEGPASAGPAPGS
ncbi:MAG: uridine kinase [Candidatus Eisenbacteria bacterium]|uniref:Uridine kinase n=1 Tax=Eiseniibacteriota bacterium TaxID=2212470 RepID=A0A956RQZ9_UNCEI|nr:uridine kinase [Candidatus Eisenbacteria bacterium]